MDLSSFLPYRIAVLSESVSQCIAQVYRERFGLSRDEWRVLAALADAGKVKTSTVIASTTLEKMQVSRAVSRLEGDGLLERIPDPEDGRGWLLRLRPAGRALHGKVVPMVQAREQFLLDALAPQEQQALHQALNKLQERAQQLSAQG
ncbi:MarR family winged helix-turn-helix transcriptional regulator [Hydrogenophaga sp. PAMC20947]|uniref:MarR family winged helix-turn-helix transcriptional regulator n=1 Tax=Hydrogenophaga sp. PAMC20947 TaxID=2565558 RepID=UPI00109DDD7D|nr:MarR family winged helix-turn-helix transcriptional regulator [Hydrogenophaga sp. PAMC20947]QCB46881.1 MarR family transcriptional regulator [Hydrogenophaga sp. PAMC20947]